MTENMHVVKYEKAVVVLFLALIAFILSMWTLWWVAKLQESTS